MGRVQLYDEPQPSYRPGHPGLPAGHHQSRRCGARLGESQVHHACPARHPHCGTVPGADAGRNRESAGAGKGVYPVQRVRQPALLENDPDYLASLASLPEAEKQALLYGSWDSFSGQVFTEWRNDPGHYQDQRWTHVIAPFAIPRHWKIYRGYDFGFSKPFSVGWYAADEEGRLYRIKELYGCTGRPNEGLRIDPVEQARRIREAEQNDPMLKGRTILGVADPAIFDESRGESIAAMMERGPHFLHWVPGDHTRLAGKMQFHYRLAFDGEGRPMFQVFNTCRHFIRTLPNLVYDESNVEDIDTRQEDHIYDECRYVLMENPISPPRQTVQPPLGDDPLELHRRARFYRV